MPAESIREVASPLRTLDPDAADDTDLEILRDVVGDARVVCLGESAHWVSQFYQLTDRITRFLVFELGFSAFVLESGLPEGLAVDQWVTGGPGELAAVARDGMTYAFGRCTERHAQLQWMREANTAHEQRVRFYGMDVPGWNATPAPGVAACLARLPPRPGDRELLAAAELGDPTRAPSPDASNAPDVPAGLTEGIAELVERAAASGDDVALRCARSAEAVVEFLAGGLYPGPGRNLRNEVMAENLRWILDREQRIVVSAHNVHLQHTPSFDGTDPIGRLLAPELDTDLVVIGTTRAPGPVPVPDLTAAPEARFTSLAGQSVAPPHSLDALLDTAGLAHHLVDLRRTPGSLLTGATAMAGETALIHLDPRQAFDAVVHVHATSPAHGTTD